MTTSVDMSGLLVLVSGTLSATALARRWHGPGARRQGGGPRRDRGGGAVERAAGPAIEISVLGPLGLRVDGSVVAVPGAKRRAVLALLALAAPGPVSVERLLDAVWPGEAPASGRAALQSHVSRLRRHLGGHADRLARTEGGYRLALEPGELDAAHLEAALRDAREVAGHDPVAARAMLEGTRATWQGPPLVDLRDVEPLAARAQVLTEVQHDALDLLASCALATAAPDVAAAAAAEALAANPLRESSVLALMRALAAQGRAAEALRAGHDLRRRLQEETGLDPSPALAALEGEIAAGPAAVDIVGPVVVVRGAAASGAAEPSARGPLPAQVLLGRGPELDGVARLVGEERLVTVVGPGGVGKTSLALEVARRWDRPDRVTVLELAAVDDGGALPEVLAAALGLESGRGDAMARCRRALGAGEHLVVLDGCEHLLGPVRALVTGLLDACPRLRVLATSRERLAVPAEQTSRLAPLPMPAEGSVDGLHDVPSMALFLDRARRSRPGFTPDPGDLASMVRIVRALDGIPLAIELAAGRLSSMTLADLEARLDRALDLLAGPLSEPSGAPGGHRTLRATLAWSYDLLGPDEQRLFRNLAVFPGGVGLATAESVAADLGIGADPATVLARLVDASMVVAELGDRPRYRMLDTLRRFGLDALEAAGETEASVARLRRWALDVVARCDAAYETEAEPEACRALVEELANLRTAWRAARDAGDLDAAAAMVADLYSLASWRDLAEVWGWFLELAEDPRLVGHPREAQVLGAASEAAWSSRGDLELSEALARRAVAVADPDDQRGTSLARWALADLLLFRGEHVEAARMAVEAREGTRWAAEGYAQAALAATYGGDLEVAREQLARAEALVGGPTLRGYLAYVRGELANAAGDRAAARAAYGEAIEGARRLGATFLEGIAEVGLVTVLAGDGSTGAALEGYAALLERWERTGSWTQQWTTIRNLADLLERLGDGQTAILLRAAADAAPEAAATGAPATRLPSAPDRAEALALARTAILGALRSRQAEQPHR
jgi:predicted ATPase/DNA-binding SARP family transcriptional activator